MRLLEDPLVGGDLLLVAVGLAAKYDFGLDYDGKLGGLAKVLWSGDHNNRWPGWRIRRVFKDDIRTYKPPAIERCTTRCTAPMVRRDGLCGRNATSFGYLTDWSSGEMSYAGACGRHAAWFNELCRANWRAKPDIVPLPCANHGGVLVPHFPRLDWRGFWRKLDPSWVEHPESRPWPKPDLQLVLGDAESPDEPGKRPLVSVVPLGGGR